MRFENVMIFSMLIVRNILVKFSVKISMNIRLYVFNKKPSQFTIDSGIRIYNWKWFKLVNIISSHYVTLPIRHYLYSRFFTRKLVKLTNSVKKREFHDDIPIRNGHFWSNFWHLAKKNSMRKNHWKGMRSQIHICPRQTDTLTSLWDWPALSDSIFDGLREPSC